MNWDRIAGNWKQTKGRIKEQWGKLTDEHLAIMDGRRDRQLGQIQESYGIARDEAERQLQQDREKRNQRGPDPAVRRNAGDAKSRRVKDTRAHFGLQ